MVSCQKCSDTPDGEMSERLKEPVLKTGDVKASVGSNPTLSATHLPKYCLQKYPRGRRGSPAKGVGCLKNAARVQIPPSAPEKPRSRKALGFFFSPLILSEQTAGETNRSLVVYVDCPVCTPLGVAYRTI